MIFLYRFILLVAVLAGGAALSAQDYGDAPSSYGLAAANTSFNERLGTQWSNDTSNPVTPAWTGDTSDDGVSTMPTWIAGTSSNSVTVDVDTDNFNQYFTMWVDLNDDGDFLDAGERFDHPSFPTDVPASYTFNNVPIPMQSYSRNGTDKIAVRFILKYDASITGPDESFGYGEVEDYLFDVLTGFTILSPATRPDGGFDVSYSETLQAVNGTGAVNWQVTGGSLPPGISLSSSGDLTGTPTAAAAGQTYNFDVTATDSSSPAETDTKNFTLHVAGLVINASANLPSATEGQAYAEALTVTHGSSPYTWAQVGGTLPAGLTLTQNGDDFELSGTPGTGAGGAAYSFDVEVSSGTVSEQKTFSIYVIGAQPAQLPFTDEFSVDKGWTLGSGQGVTWEVDACGAPYNPQYGGPEPTTDRSPTSDNRILGDNIGATYANGIVGTIWAESPAVDCAGINDVELGFWRWLNVEEPTYDHAYIEVSPDDGQTWTQVWENASTIADTGWTEQKINISSVAGNQGAVRVRFGIGPTDGSWDYAGWCIDDLVIRELPATNKLVLTDFEIDSAYSIGGDPSCYTGEQYTIDLTLDNTTANDIQVNSVDFTVTEINSTTPENVGTWTLNVAIPFTVSANTTGHVVTGTFDCTSLASSGANVTLDVRCLIEGTEQTTSKPVETDIAGRLYVDNGPPPSLEVHETSYQGPLVESGQSAAGTNRDFGDQDIDTGGTQWVNIILLNTTGVDVDVDEPVLAGADAAHFRLDTAEWTSPVMTLTTSGTGSQIFFSVRFNPHDLGQLEAQVEFTHTAPEPDTNPIVVPITGNGIGTAPELEVHEIDYQGPQVTDGQPAAGTNRDFGSVAAGASSQWVNIVLWNRFAGDTTINPLPSITGPDAADFAVDTSPMTNPHVIPGDVDFTGTIYFSVRFSPQGSSTLGTKTANVTFGHNAPNPGANPFSFEIIGEVTPPGPGIAVYELDSTGAPSTTITNGASAGGRRDFGTQSVTAGPTAYLEVEILNPGSSALTLGMPTLTGADPGEFVIETTGYSPPYSTSVAPAGVTKFRVAFDPANTGTLEATVEFTHNAVSGNSPFTFDVTGLGIPDAPNMGVFEGGAAGPTIANGDPAIGTARDFGSRDIHAGPSSPLTIHIANTGTQDLVPGTPTLEGPDADDFVLDLAGLSTNVPPQGTASFTVAFNPDSFGARSATVEFTHNDGLKTSPFVFEVAGFGDGPEIEVRLGSAAGPGFTSGDSHAFGRVELANMPSAPVTLFVVNTGNTDLVVPTPVLGGPHAGDFNLDAGGWPGTLAPNDDASFTVEFDAGQVGLKEAGISIDHNAGGPDPFVVLITGTGEDPNGVQINTASQLPDGRGGQSYSETLQASGGTAPYGWALRDGLLPPGISLGSGGELNGVLADEAGLYTFEVRVTDSAGGTNDKTFTINVTTPNLTESDGPGNSGCSNAQHGAVVWVLAALAAIAFLRSRRNRPMPRR